MSAVTSSCSQAIKGVCIVIAAIILAIGMIGGGYAVSKGLISIRTADRFVTVKGLAEQSVMADIATWSLSFNAAGDDLNSVLATIEQHQAVIVDFLKEGGIIEEEISLGRFSVTDLLAQAYRNTEVSQGRFIMNAEVKVLTQKVEEIAALNRKKAALVRKGVVLTDNYGADGAPAYTFTSLNAVKPVMLAEATANAREAAAEFANHSGATLGGIRQANQGVFSILPADGSGSEREQINKTVRVVATVEYFLE